MMVIDYCFKVVYDFFTFVFDLLPIPSVPEWVSSVLNTIRGYVSSSVGLFSWIFPASLWQPVINISLDLMYCRVIYDIYHHFRPHN